MHHEKLERLKLKPVTSELLVATIHVQFIHLSVCLITHFQRLFSIIIVHHALDRSVRPFNRTEIDDL